MQFALHPKTVGPFVELGGQLFPLTNYSDSHIYFAIGLGFYFGEQSKK
jgi:hypothetical protein